MTLKKTSTLNKSYTVKIILSSEKEEHMLSDDSCSGKNKHLFNYCIYILKNLLSDIMFNINTIKTKLHQLMLVRKIIAVSIPRKSFCEFLLQQIEIGEWIWKQNRGAVKKKKKNIHIYRDISGQTKTTVDFKQHTARKRHQLLYLAPLTLFPSKKKFWSWRKYWIFFFKFVKCETI